MAYEAFGTIHALSAMDLPQFPSRSAIWNYTGDYRRIALKRKKEMANRQSEEFKHDAVCIELISGLTRRHVTSYHVMVPNLPDRIRF